MQWRLRERERKKKLISTSKNTRGVLSLQAHTQKKLNGNLKGREENNLNSPTPQKRSSPAQHITMKHSSGEVGKSSVGFHKASPAPLGCACSCERGGVLHALTDKTQLEKKYTHTKLGGGGVKKKRGKTHSYTTTQGSFH